MAAPSSVHSRQTRVLWWMWIFLLLAKRTDLVELDDVGLCALLAEEGLCGLAVRAVGLGEDSCNVGITRVVSAVVAVSM
jgi:hypothetical protein